jgi:hypothetical protein
MRDNPVIGFVIRVDVARKYQDFQEPRTGSTGRFHLIGLTPEFEPHRARARDGSLVRVAAHHVRARRQLIPRRFPAPWPVARPQTGRRMESDPFPWRQAFLHDPLQSDEYTARDEHSRSRACVSSWQTPGRPASHTTRGCGLLFRLSGEHRRCPACRRMSSL